jgi:phospholipid/cholesterol/gamma-HCH transport system permease protein
MDVVRTSDPHNVCVGLSEGGSPMSTDTGRLDSGSSPGTAGSIPDTRERSRTLTPPRWLGKVGEPLVTVGEIFRLGFRVFAMAIRQPYGYWADTRDQAYSMLKLCWFPMAVATFGFGFGAPGLSGGAIFHIFGIPSRLGSFFVFASIREFAPFIDGMVVAGVVGTAVTADLGARKIREELDAMEVLGVDPVRTLIIPRVLAITVMTTIFDIMALIMGLISGYLAAGSVFGADRAAYIASMTDLLNVPDVIGSLAKAACFGLVIGVVSCYMGLNVKGGSIGVGRAVNQSVVIAFAGVWIVNFIFTSLLLGLSPSLYVFK